MIGLQDLPWMLAWKQTRKETREKKDHRQEKRKDIFLYVLRSPDLEPTGEWRGNWEPQMECEAPPGPGWGSVAEGNLPLLPLVSPQPLPVTPWSPIQAPDPDTSKTLSYTRSWFPSLGFLTFDSSLLFVSVSLSVSAFLSLMQRFPVSLFLAQLSKVLSPFCSHFSP